TPFRRAAEEGLLDMEHSIQVGMRGPTSYEALEYVRKLDGLDIVGFDLVEVLPTYDANEITAVLASAVMYEMITLIALKKRRQAEDGEFLELKIEEQRGNSV
ncbi:arginase family protein, partial [Bacillus norwichensis]